MSVNIWVTAPHDGQKILLAWGEHLHSAVNDDGDNIITNFSESTVLTVRETPAEVAALVAAEIRKQRRYELAARIRDEIGYFALPEEEAKAAAMSIQAADALLAALDATEGAE